MIAPSAEWSAASAPPPPPFPAARCPWKHKLPVNLVSGRRSVPRGRSHLLLDAGSYGSQKVLPLLAEVFGAQLEKTDLKRTADPG